MSNWRQLCKQLLSTPTQELWEKAYQEYFIARLETRYFKPIRRLRPADGWAGEGFSIMVILCSLVEFLESTVRGLRYKHGGPWSQYEYGSSRDVFIDFLVNRKPFQVAFTDRGIALDFYLSVRCGLMHEAQTKRGWTISAASYRKAIIDRTQRIVFRDDFHEAVREFVDTYRRDLLAHPEIQAAFIRKFDSLCE